jgi:glucosamine--fructose-6-phosphate aminotransferase (isomerizing)
MTALMQDILNEPHELTRTLEHTLGPGRAAVESAARVVDRVEQVTITGIGSSWHAGMAILSLFEAGSGPSAAGRPASLIDASELLHFAQIPRNSALLVLSRSGRSVEVVQLLEKARRAGAPVIGITNTPDSPLAQSAEVTLRLEAAFDHNVSVTMYSALTLAGGLLASAVLGTLDGALTAALRDALAASSEALAGWREQVEQSAWIAGDTPTYFLARGGSLATCHEARLLWEEAAKTTATAMTTGGFRHGPQEILGPGTPLRVGLWIDGERLRDQDLALAADLRRHGARVMLVGQGLPAEAADLVFRLPAIPAPWQFLIDAVPAQLAAERLARVRGVDCDSFSICPYIVEDEGGL